MILRLWRLIKITFFLLLINTPLLYSNSLDLQISLFYPKIPTPPQTQKVETQKMQMGEVEFVTHFYTSELSFEEIKNFYINTLIKKGWKLLKPPLEDEDLKRKMQNILTFTKEEWICTISYLPLEENHTNYSVSIGKKPSSKPESSLYKKTSSIDISLYVPVYPYSKRISFTSTSRGFIAGYTSGDSIEKIYKFYEERMPNFGWELEEALPPISKKVDTDSCPYCSQAGLKGSYTTVIASLRYTKNTQETCIIGLTKIIGANIPEEVIITISYEK